MSHNSTVFQIFVASPSDVREERDVLESVISELNRTWSRSLGIMFQLIRWENDTRPAFGADPQAVINEQIGDTYDVFIGILWSRFGTPTPRAISGTLEEFQRAIDRVNSGINAPEVMIYFKDLPISPSKIDIDQLKLVSEFRSAISGRGGLYSMFEDTPGFQSSLSAHLASLAQKFSSQIRESKNRDTFTVTIAQPVDDPIDDLGYLDYADIYHAGMTEMTSNMEIISEATRRVGERIGERVVALNSISEGNQEVQSARNIIKFAANDMDEYAEIMKLKIPLLTSSRSSAMNALANALNLHKEISEGDLVGANSLRVGLSNLKDTAYNSNENLRIFLSMVEGFPRMTSEINKAKRSVSNQLNLMISEVDILINNIENIMKSLDKILNNLGGADKMT